MGGKLIYSINENFFRVWNSKMAYILGFTFADGSLSKRTVEWVVQKKDKEILERINSSMNSNYPIKVVQNGQAVRLRVSNPKIVNHLGKFKLNITKRKRRFPNVPNKYLRDFIRGFLDGDGWISLRKGRLEIIVGLTSSSYEFLKELVSKLNQKVKLSVNNLRTKRKIQKNGKISRIYQIDWYSKNAIEVINFLYDGLESSDLYLKRKFIRRMEAMEIFEKIKRDITRKDVEEKFSKPIKIILKQLLYSKKLSVAQIAAKLEVNVSTIYEWLKKTKIKLPPKRRKFTISKCPVCGKRFKKHRVSKKYCSITCAYIGKRTGKIVGCIMCNKRIYRPAWWFKVNTYSICSRECQREWKKKLLESGVLRRSKKTGRFLPSTI